MRNDKSDAGKSMSKPNYILSRSARGNNQKTHDTDIPQITKNSKFRYLSQVSLLYIRGLLLIRERRHDIIIDNLCFSKRRRFLIDNIQSRSWSIGAVYKLIEWMYVYSERNKLSFAPCRQKQGETKQNKFKWSTATAR